MSSSSSSSRSPPEALLEWGLRSAALLAGALLGFIVIFLVMEALPALRALGLWAFLSGPGWHPSDGLYNLSAMVSGTLCASLGAVLLAGPLGLLSALFCRFYAPERLGRLYRRLIELLAGVPSVVYGFWGLMVLVPLIGRLRPPGPSLLAAILILALMILPTVALLADAALGAVDPKQLRAAAALGLSRELVLLQVALPIARPGLFVALLLASGRALGETMAVLMVSGNIVKHPDSLFSPVRTLTANIALEMAYAMGTHRAALFVSSLFLAFLVVALVALAARVERA